jgi:NAD+ synthase (glutamine-hydrolysing)
MNASSPVLRIALAQINSVVGGLNDNVARMKSAYDAAREKGAALAIFPELSVCGYPPEDLLLNPDFVAETERAAGQLCAATSESSCAIVAGSLESEGRAVHNAAVVWQGGRRVASYRKIELPNYGVFDEKRYFTEGRRPLVLEMGAFRVGISICEDIWIPSNLVERELAAAHLDLVVNISGSPFHAGKVAERRTVIARFAAAVGAPVAYCNLVGGQDELVFDGASLIVAPDGSVLATAAHFDEDLLLWDVPLRAAERRPVSETECDRVRLLDPSPVSTLSPRVVRPLQTGDELAEIHAALVLGTRDYVRKNRFTHVVIGLSGGIDSALTAALAVEALGAASVTGVTMPTRFSSRETRSDAALVAEKLGIPCLEIPIDGIYQDFLDRLKAPLQYDGPAAPPSAAVRGGGGTASNPGAARAPGVEAENLQARIRGNVIMALSNRFGWLALTTGNKSEMAMGYCTLYGDMAGGFAVLKDVYKTTVFALARRINAQAGREVIPQSTIDRAPSAELRPDQKDEDSLPPYAILDPILKAYVERDRSVDAIATKTGCDPALVREIMTKVDLNEYKRRQAPPGVKITPRAFGRDRRMPVTNRFGRG